jgi:hypothetical protein
MFWVINFATGPAWSTAQDFLLAKITLFSVKLFQGTCPQLGRHIVPLSTCVSGTYSATICSFALDQEPNDGLSYLFSIFMVFAIQILNLTDKIWKNIQIKDKNQIIKS